MATESAATPVATPVATPGALPVIPMRELLPWAVFAFVIGLFLLYFVGAEQGATALFSGQGVHEFVHDGRHLLGFPCH
jgi:cobalt transporter subunit CbtB